MIRTLPILLLLACVPVDVDDEQRSLAAQGGVYAITLLGPMTDVERVTCRRLHVAVSSPTAGRVVLEYVADGCAPMTGRVTAMCLPFAPGSALLVGGQRVKVHAIECMDNGAPWDFATLAP